MDGKTWKEEHARLDEIDPLIPSEEREILKKAIAYRRSKGYYEEDERKTETRYQQIK